MLSFFAKSSRCQPTAIYLFYVVAHDSRICSRKQQALVAITRYGFLLTCGHLRGFLLYPLSDFF